MVFELCRSHAGLSRLGKSLHSLSLGAILSHSHCHPHNTLSDRASIVFRGGVWRGGLAGLGNLGNTCFMNSSLQCLSHAAPLARMFLSGAYRQDINKDNPLGNRGELAEAFGMLLKLLWQVHGSLLALPSALQLHLLMWLFLGWLAMCLLNWRLSAPSADLPAPCCFWASGEVLPWRHWSAESPKFSFSPQKGSTGLRRRARAACRS